MFGMRMKPRHTTTRISKKLGLANLSFFLDAFSSIKKSELEFSNFDPEKIQFYMMFNMFVNMFWKAEGFSHMWVQFEIGYYNNLY